MKTTKTVFHYSSTDVSFVQHGDGEIANELMPEIYSVSHHKLRGFYLTRGFDFGAPATKLYGDVGARVDRILNAYDLNNGKSLGVALHGHKGTGKTMLAREVAHKAIALGMPVIMVNNAYGGDEFCQFICSIDQRALVIFEEFDKSYEANDDTKQQIGSILTMLDGLFPTDKLWLFTSNSLLPEFMMNRPGRVYYAYEYGPSLSQDMVREYCGDHLLDSSRIDEVVRVCSFAVTFTFDMMHALVQEMNRYPNDSIDVLLEALNIDLFEGFASYEYEVIATFVEGKYVANISKMVEPGSTNIGKDEVNFHINGLRQHIATLFNVDKDHEDYNVLYDELDMLGHTYITVKPSEVGGYVDVNGHFVFKGYNEGGVILDVKLGRKMGKSRMKT